MSIIQGCIQTAHGLLFGNVIWVWSLPRGEEAQAAAKMEGIMFLSLAFVAGGSAFMKGICFAYSGETLTFRLRSRVFKSMLYQDMSWFDNKANNIGSLCTRLSEDAALVQGATGIRMGNMLQGLTTVSISIGLALFYSVKLGLLGALFVVILNVLGYLEEIYLADEADDDVINVEHSSLLVAQAVNQIRTIASLHIEKKFILEYTECLKITKRYKNIVCHFFKKHLN
jgi:ABC-type multidrug transport system fused ATPase/permease subunit